MNSVCYLLRRTNLEVTRRLTAELGKGTLAYSGSYDVIRVAGAHPGISQVEIARRLSVDKANAALLIRSLESKGWLARKRSTSDRRQRGVYLTASGEHRLRALDRETSAFETTLLSQFSRKEQQLLLDFLKRLADVTS